MKSLADALPPEIAQQIHPDWRKNEAAYWSMREQLLNQYQGQWIGFADGGVIAAAPTPLEVFLAVQQSGRHPFVIRVGHEDEPWYRIRRVSFAYDTSYPVRHCRCSAVQIRVGLTVPSESWPGCACLASRLAGAVTMPRLRQPRRHENGDTLPNRCSTRWTSPRWAGSRPTSAIHRR